MKKGRPKKARIKRSRRWFKCALCECTTPYDTYSNGSFIEHIPKGDGVVVGIVVAPHFRRIARPLTVCLLHTPTKDVTT